MSRRRLLKLATAAGATAGIGGFPMIALAQEAFALPALPYADDALAPVISSNTVNFHYGKHHKGYSDNLNRMVAGTDFANQKLEEIMKASAVNPNRAALFNNAAQVWNHNFYWNSMSPKGGGMPSGALKDKIEADFMGFDNLRKQFTETTVGQFASGWGWLVQDPKDKKLRVMRTGNADSPVVQGLVPLLTCDVWEHAYYLDYQNRRADYVNAWFDKLANWEFAARNLQA